MLRVPSFGIERKDFGRNCPYAAVTQTSGEMSWGVEGLGFQTLPLPPNDIKKPITYTLYPHFLRGSWQCPRTTLHPKP